MPEQLQRDGVGEKAPEFGDVVVRVAAQVLETMFFEEAVPSACNHAWLATAISAHIYFDGSHCGEFLLSVSPDTAQSIASGFLGVGSGELTKPIQPR